MCIRDSAHADRRVGEIDLHIDIAWLHWPGYLRKQGPEVTECSVALQTRPLLVGCTRRRDVGRGLARYRCGFALIEPEADRLGQGTRFHKARLELGRFAQIMLAWNHARLDRFFLGVE